MTIERTQLQDDEDSRQARKLSLQPTRPPTDVPGYEAQQFLGSGAYGAVWQALDRNTGRRVAIKFYAHRSGLDWTLLSREVEKLVILSADRYVVQLLEVGWESEPPYYVMEYIERGSLDDRLRLRGPLPVTEAVALFRDVAIGLGHAHGKGVLHCDLKPGNVLLDQDDRPRIADFGQSRLSHEQLPALGTLFYMAPEQADLQAVPDARWDVYALGALLFCMLTGTPPYRSDDATTDIESGNTLEERLHRYQRYIKCQPPPSQHRQVPGVDRALAEIIERCLEPNQELRFPNVQAVIEALDRREARHARQPIRILGLIGPALLMIVVGLFAWRALGLVVEKTEQALTNRALEGNQFAAKYVAKAAANELDRHFDAVEHVATNPDFLRILEQLLGNAELSDLRERLNRPQVNPSGPDAVSPDEVVTLRRRFRDHDARRPLGDMLQSLAAREKYDKVASWFVNDARGLQVGRYPDNETVGQNWAWRTYFHGGEADYAADWRPSAGEHLEQTSLSAVFQSKATGQWIAAVSTPIFRPQDGRFLGVVALTLNVGQIVKLPVGDGLVPVLVDSRPGANRGQILQHPLYDEITNDERLDENLSRFRIGGEHLEALNGQPLPDYADPLATHPRGNVYSGSWLVGTAPVLRGAAPSGLTVLVQERRDQAIGQMLQALKSSLLTIGLVALVMVAAVWSGLWTFVAYALSRGHRRRARSLPAADNELAETVPLGQ